MLQREKYGSKLEKEKIRTSVLKMRHERERGVEEGHIFLHAMTGQLGTSPSGDLGEMVKSHFSLLHEG